MCVRWQGNFGLQNTDINPHLKHSCADRVKKGFSCFKLYEKCKGNYKYSSKKVNATSRQSWTSFSFGPVQTRGLYITQTVNRSSAPPLHRQNLSHPILQSWQLSHIKYEDLFLRDFLGTYLRRIPVAEDMHQSAIYPVGGEGEFFRRHHLFFM